MKQTIDNNFDELGRLDAIAGDGDHGIGMQRGVTAAVAAAAEALNAGVGAGTLLGVAGDAWSNRAGGTSGALWGVILRAIGNQIGDSAKPDSKSVGQGVSAALKGVTDSGKAHVGDKTMVDTLAPFAEALNAVTELDLLSSWSAAAEVAENAAAATANLAPKIGRARLHAEKSVGIPDPGALSMALIIRSVEHALRKNHG